MHVYIFTVCNLVFGPIPASETDEQLPSLIGDHEDHAFCPYVDDHNAAAVDIKTKFDFLQYQYSSRLRALPEDVEGFRCCAGYRTYHSPK